MTKIRHKCFVIDKGEGMRKYSMFYHLFIFQLLYLDLRIDFSQDNKDDNIHKIKLKNKKNIYKVGIPTQYHHIGFLMV